MDSHLSCHVGSGLEEQISFEINSILKSPI